MVAAIVIVGVCGLFTLLVLVIDSEITRRKEIKARRDKDEE